MKLIASSRNLYNSRGKKLSIVSMKVNRNENVDITDRKKFKDKRLKI